MCVYGTGSPNADIFRYECLSSEFLPFLCGSLHSKQQHCTAISMQQGETQSHPWKNMGILISSTLSSSEKLAFFSGQPEGEAGEMKWVMKLETNACFFKCWNTLLCAWRRQTKCSSSCLMQGAFYQKRMSTSGINGLAYTANIYIPP